jgi:hypothetical protein
MPAVGNEETEGVKKTFAGEARIDYLTGLI